jgi:hypothetical protein
VERPVVPVREGAVVPLGEPAAERVLPLGCEAVRAQGLELGTQRLPLGLVRRETETPNTAKRVPG